MDKLVVGAEHAQFGRSAPLSVLAGKKNVRALTLTLLPTGSLSGRVAQSLGPKAVRSVSVLYADDDIGRPGFGATAFVRADNSYSFARLAPGVYKVFSGSTQTPSSSRVRFKKVEVLSGQGAQADFASESGDSGIRLTVEASGGAPLHSAQVLVVSGHVAATTGKEFNRVVTADGLRLRNLFYSEGETLQIEELQAGLYSVCLIPLGGDYRDPEYTKRFTPEMVGRLSVYCEDIVVPADVVIESSRTVPPWNAEIVIENSSEVNPD